MTAAINTGPKVRRIRRTKTECAKDSDRLTKLFCRHGPRLEWGNLEIGYLVGLAPARVQVIIGRLCKAGVITRETVTFRVAGTFRRIRTIKVARTTLQPQLTPPENTRSQTKAAWAFL